MYNKEKHFPEDNTIFISVFTPVEGVFNSQDLNC